MAEHLPRGDAMMGRVLAAIPLHYAVSAAEVCYRAGASRRTVYKYLNQGVNEGLLRRAVWGPKDVRYGFDMHRLDNRQAPPGVLLRLHVERNWLPASKSFHPCERCAVWFGGICPECLPRWVAARKRGETRTPVHPHAANPEVEQALGPPTDEEIRRLRSTLRIVARSL